MSAYYYNEIDPFAASWLRNLMKEGLIPDGTVDERSICDVSASDLVGYDQCHFFAGIGGWSRALRLAGWGDDRPVWTGSCPCQPFSTAGKRKGTADERHLWPVWMRLIRECRPPVVFGEQVAAAIGKNWLDIVFSDLEGEGYACGSAVLGAHSVGAPHKRSRLYWVGDASGHRQGARGRLQDQIQLGQPSQAGGMADADQQRGEPDRRGSSGEGAGTQDCEGRHAEQLPSGGRAPDFWSNCEWLPCRDGKTRPVEPGLMPLADGVPQRASKLRAYGNAIVPQVGAAFIKAYLAVLGKTGPMQYQGMRNVELDKPPRLCYSGFGG